MTTGSEGSNLAVISGTHISFTQMQEMPLARSAVFKNSQEIKQRQSPPFEHNLYILTMLFTYTSRKSASTKTVRVLLVPTV